MDPKACLENAIYHYFINDNDVTQECIEEYTHWRHKGGYEPTLLTFNGTLYAGDRLAGILFDLISTY